MKHLIRLNLLMTMLFFFSWVTKAQDRPEDGEIFILQSDYLKDLPASVLEVYDGTDGLKYGHVLVLENRYFPQGSKFVYTSVEGTGKYGDPSDPSIMPLVFVNAVKESGEIDETIKFGFPAHFLVSSTTNVKASEYTYLKSVFNEAYDSKGLSFEDEVKKLSEYMSSLPEKQTIKTNQSVSSSVSDVSAAATANESSDLNSASNLALSSNLPSSSLAASSLTTPAAQSVTTLPSTKDIYYKDQRLRNVIEVRTGEALDSVIQEVKKEDGTIGYFRKDLEISKGTQFVPIIWQSDDKRDKETQEIYRSFYMVDGEGNIAKDENGERAIYVLPISKLHYKDPADGMIKQVSEKTKLYPVVSSEVAQAIPSQVGGPALAQTQAVTAPQNEVPKKFPTRPISKTPAPKVDISQLKLTAPKASADKEPEVGLSLSECKNKIFADQFSKVGENCELMELENFSLVKSQLIEQLKGNSKENFKLLNSGVVAIDNTTKMCSKVDLSHESYLDDTLEQKKIDDYRQKMKDSYQGILSNIHTNKSGRIGAAFLSGPQESVHTYSCDRTKAHCRFSFDHYAPEKLPLVQEVSSFSDDLLTQDQISIYGPNSESKYLVVFKKGGHDVRALVLQEDSSFSGNKPVKNIIKQMSSFSKDFKYSKLSEMKQELKSETLSKSTMGHFISSETIYPNGQKEFIKERLGSPKSMAFIGKIRQNKTFYELKCRMNPLARQSELPNWDNKTGTVE